MFIKICGIALSLIVITKVHVLCSSDHQHDECIVWRNISNYLEKKDKISVKCHKNSECTGLDCNGDYNMGLLDQFMDVSLCFGMYLNPCEEPTTLNIYVDILTPSKTSFVHAFTGNETVLIPGSTYNVVDQAKAEGFLVVTISPLKVNDKKYILTSVKFKVRLEIFGRQFWPGDSQLDLVPKMLIPVAPCDPSEATPTHQPYSCTSQQWSTKAQEKTTPQPKTKDNTGSLPITPFPAGLLPGTPCKFDTMYECQDNQMCQPKEKKSKEGICVCARDYTYNEFINKCTPINPLSTTLPMFIYPVHAEVKSYKNLIIIASCSAGAVLVVSVILTIIILRYRAHRQRYGNHQQLLANDDFDDDEPIDITT